MWAMARPHCTHDEFEWHAHLRLYKAGSTTSQDKQGAKIQHRDIMRKMPDGGMCPKSDPKIAKTYPTMLRKCQVRWLANGPITAEPIQLRGHARTAFSGSAMPMLL